MQKLLVIGAGAIGRGYLPWVFDPSKYVIDFVDANSNLVSSLSVAGHYHTYRTRDGRYDELRVSINKIYHVNQLTQSILDEYDFILTAVGPRNFLKLTNLFTKSNVPVVAFENQRDVVTSMRIATGREDIYFGIPDVITSSTASSTLLAKDRNAIITEDGKTYIENGARDLGGDLLYCDELEIRKQWAAKLYIHNSPHCIAAYLGHLCKASYLHESMEWPASRNVVIGATQEMSQMVINTYGVDAEFAKYYADKEISRFSNKLLFDPISRVAREPFRKLGLNDRLIGATRKAYVGNVHPTNMLLGIMSAFLFNKPDDADAIISFLFRTLSPEQFLGSIIRLNQGDVIFDSLIHSWDANLLSLKEIMNDV
jgi:mannitol-1-phosphate 5-dehydrogenase